MNPIAVAFLILTGVASFFSLSDGHWPTVKAGSWDKEMAQEWNSARNLRPCIGAHDPACKYPVKEAK